MWKLLATLALITQLSTFAAVITPNHEVPLNCDPHESEDNFVFIDCYLIEVKSSKDHVFVTSSNFDAQNKDFANKFIRMELIGNVNYPEYFPKNLAKIISGIGNFFYTKTPLKYISRDDFKEFGSKLTMLGLKDNEIEDIPFDTFYDLIKLDYLDIRHNHIKILPPNLFAKSSKFGTLFAESNEIAELHPDLFKNCPHFFILYIESNKIEELHKDLFINNPNMTIIAMRHNKIKNVPFDFTKFELLDSADFTHNAGTCDTMYFSYKPYVEYYNDDEQKKWIKNVPDFQKKIEETCRG